MRLLAKCVAEDKFLHLIPRLGSQCDDVEMAAINDIGDLDLVVSRGGAVAIGICGVNGWHLGRHEILGHAEWQEREG